MPVETSFILLNFRFKKQLNKLNLRVPVQASKQYYSPDAHIITMTKSWGVYKKDLDQDNHRDTQDDV